MLRTAHRSRGLTLIELMIGLAIMALLLALGMPAFSAFLANTKVRNSAEALQVGLSLARSEALRLNQDVEFVLTNDVVDLGNFASVAPATDGIHWLVRGVDPSTGNLQLLDSRSGFEGTGQGGATSSIAVVASHATVTFRGLGGTKGIGSMATFDFSNPGAGACHTTSTPGPIRCLRIQVTLAGQVRMCDPSIDATTHPGDTRLC